MQSGCFLLLMVWMSSRPQQASFWISFVSSKPKRPHSSRSTKRHVGWRQTVWHLAGYSTCTGFIQDTSGVLVPSAEQLQPIGRNSTSISNEPKLTIQVGNQQAKGGWFHNQVKQSTRLHVTVVGACKFKQLLVLQCVLNSFCIFLLPIDTELNAFFSQSCSNFLCIESELSPEIRTRTSFLLPNRESLLLLPINVASWSFRSIGQCETKAVRYIQGMGMSRDACYQRRRAKVKLEAVKEESAKNEAAWSVVVQQPRAKSLLQVLPFLKPHDGQRPKRQYKNRSKNCT